MLMGRAGENREGQQSFPPEKSKTAGSSSDDKTIRLTSKIPGLKSES